MSVATECVHGGDPFSCPPCQRSNRRPKRISAWRESKVFKAKYEGVCKDCGDGIGLEDWIVQFVRGSETQYAHAECAR